MRNLHQLFVLCTASQIIGGDFAKFCGLLRIFNLLWPPNLSPKSTDSELLSYQRKAVKRHVKMSCLTDSCIVFTLKMEFVSKNTTFGPKMMVKSGLQKIFLKFLHAGNYFPLLHESAQNHIFGNKNGRDFKMNGILEYRFHVEGKNDA